MTPPAILLSSKASAHETTGTGGKLCQLVQVVAHILQRYAMSSAAMDHLVDTIFGAQPGQVGAFLFL